MTKFCKIIDVLPGEWIKFTLYDRPYVYHFADNNVCVGSQVVSGVNASNWVSQQSYGQLTLNNLIMLADAFVDGKEQNYQSGEIADKSKDILHFILRSLFIDGYAQPYIQMFPECATPPEVMIDRVHYTVDPDVLSRWARICRARHLTYEAEILDRAVESRNGTLILHEDLPPHPVTEEMETMLAEFLSETF